MTDTITLTGLVATIPRLHVTPAGVTIVSFRLASSQRRFDRSQNKWIDGDTNWYGVSTYRHLATNLLASLSKGERVVVTGRLRVKQWTSGQKSGTAVEVDADAVGHDLTWGTARWSRTTPSASASSIAEMAEGFPPEPVQPEDDSGAAAAYSGFLPSSSDLASGLFGGEASEAPDDDLDDEDDDLNDDRDDVSHDDADDGSGRRDRDTSLPVPF